MIMENWAEARSRADPEASSSPDGYRAVCSTSGRIALSSFPRAVADSDGDKIKPNVSPSAHAHSAGLPFSLGAQAAAPPSDPAETLVAFGTMPMKLEMKELAELPDRLPPINRMIGRVVALGTVP
jgi:hypothetical protein